MQFHLLGPLEVIDDSHPVPLRGVKQRAALGFLLLHANQVVAASRLLRALWQHDTPPTARKMLQNAVTDIRRLLVTDTAGTPSAALLTHAPGYLLHVDADSIDLRRFELLTAKGRRDLAAGAWQPAAAALREALGLWRGEALADLVEKGIRWPELAAVQEQRLAALEDCFDAELACGHHREIVGELETLAETEPPRERLHGQLMVALYRSGRQSDALGVYRRTHSALVDDLGIEPGRELRELHRMILDHDQALDLPPGSRSVTVQTPPSSGAPCIAAETGPGTDGQPPRRTRLSALLVTTRMSTGTGTDADSETVFDRAVATTCAEIDRCGGTVAGTVGSMVLGLFGLPPNGEAGGAERAVHAALAIRERFGQDARAGVAVRAAVSTGDVVLFARPDDTAPPRALAAEVIDGCVRLLAFAPAGGVLVCDSTNEDSRGVILYSAERAPAGGWEPLGVLPEEHDTGPEPVVDHDLGVLRGLLERVRRRNRPHLVTLLAEPGSPRAAGLLMGLQETVQSYPTVVRLLGGGASPADGAAGATALAVIVRSYSGVLDSDSDSVAEGKLTESVQRLVGAGDLAAWMIVHLLPLLLRDEGSAETLKAVRWLLEEIAAQRPLIVVVEDLHRADEALVEFIGGLVEQISPVPLLVIAMAHPDLLHNRPAWGKGTFDSTIITLDARADPSDHQPESRHHRPAFSATRAPTGPIMGWSRAAVHR
ncbi:BTAD domain-containing putative transcriptional regulator [Nocardiopsis ansamitocini]|uniref:OmpR/PhoB-type domain-containing protein n=1 Tax=Nocardiopsis ansamitocini TaxID=1670832 RepID=A0A9W6P6V6_9ACTN|nr:BTAD domain-containing putative transcriptional regulator [Nocardiopsis ansamitocini]GLU48159.1 hypothetical protein Nans01_25100 [Nocardiopsis ansamitocini]